MPFYFAMATLRGWKFMFCYLSFEVTNLVPCTPGNLGFQKIKYYLRAKNIERESSEEKKKTLDIIFCVREKRRIKRLGLVHAVYAVYGEKISM